MGSDYLTPFLCYRAGAEAGAGFFLSTSVPTLPAAISRRAITVALSRLGSTSGEAPAPSCRARYVAARVRLNRLLIRLRQSSTVMRAMSGFPGSKRSALAADDPGELLPCSVEVFVNYSVFDLSGMRHLGLCACQAALDHAVRILPPAA